MQSGKHCYCDKLIAGSYANGKRMLDVAAATGAMLHSQLSFLYNRETRLAKRLIDAGRLGHIYHARSTGFRRRNRPFVDGYGTEKFVDKTTSGGGALCDMGVYHISRLLYMLNTPTPQRISEKICQETPNDDKHRASSGYCVEELGLGLVRFKGGLTMDIIESWAIHMNPFGGSFIAGSQRGVPFRPTATSKTWKPTPRLKPIIATGDSTSLNPRSWSMTVPSTIGRLSYKGESPCSPPPKSPCKPCSLAKAFISPARSAARSRWMK